MVTRRAFGGLALAAVSALALRRQQAEAAVPIRAAFYYPWFPETTMGRYTPLLGQYDSGRRQIIRQHIDMMQYGRIQAGIASWWGQGSKTDERFSAILSASEGTDFKWCAYYEPEGDANGTTLGSPNPSATAIRADLRYIKQHYATHPNYLRVNGRPVIFVWASAEDGAGMADRWKQANTLGFYVSLKVFPGYQTIASQPQSWHQYGPAVAVDQQGDYAITISPGFWHYNEATPRLARDLARWQQNVATMKASGCAWHLITSFNEWGEGTAVESSNDWPSESGYGPYLDVLRNI